MAIVTRRYVDVGPPTLELAQIPAVINKTYGRATIDIDVDNNADLVATLDEFMASANLVFSGTTSPKQVFRYAAVGGEGSLFTINAAKGFAARVTNAYNVQVTISRNGTAIKIPTVVEGSQTTTQFDIELSADIEVGDVLQFTVEDR